MENNISAISYYFARATVQIGFAETERDFSMAGV